MIRKSKIPDLSIWGGTVLTMDEQCTLIPNGQIDIRDGLIVEIKSNRKLQKPRAKKLIDARHCLVMPGLINGHTHTGMSLLRGVADDLPLQQWLNEKIFPLERKWGDPKFVYLGTQLACIEMIRSGTTTFNDMYYHEEFAAKAVHEAGLRAICGQTVIEISGVEKKSDIFEKFDEFLKKISPYPRVMGAIAPHSIYGVSDATWLKIVEYARKRDLLVHVHLQETRQELEDCLKQRKLTPTQFFEKIGLWKQRAVAAHATCLTEGDIEILGRNKVGIAHNPESNLKLGTEIAPIVELRKKGAKVVLGTDGTASNNNLDLFQEADVAAKLQVFRKGVGELNALEVVKILTIEGASALGLSDRLGSLEVGKAADVIAVDVSGAHAIPLYNPYSHLVYSAGGQDVKHTVVDGTVLMENRKIKILDEAKILAQAQKFGNRIKAGLKKNPSH